MEQKSDTCCLRSSPLGHCSGSGCVSEATTPGHQPLFQDSGLLPDPANIFLPSAHLGLGEVIASCC